jgi:hypothetical protein
MSGLRQYLFASDLIEHDGGDLPRIDRKRRLTELSALRGTDKLYFPKNWNLAHASRSQRERARKTPS